MKTATDREGRVAPPTTSSWVRQVSIAGSHIPLGAPMVVVLERTGKTVDLKTIGDFLDSYRQSVASLKELKALNDEAASHGDASPSSEIARLKATCESWKSEAERLGLAARAAEEKLGQHRASDKLSLAPPVPQVNKADLDAALRAAEMWRLANEESRAEVARITKDWEDVRAEKAAIYSELQSTKADLEAAREEIGRLTVLVSFGAKENATGEGPWVPEIERIKSRLAAFERAFPWVDKI
jgi:hypothetical protein